MKLSYKINNDTLNIDFTNKRSVHSFKVAPFVFLYFDEDGDLIGIDIDRASKLIDLTHLEVESLPVNKLSVAQKNPTL